MSLVVVLAVGEDVKDQHVFRRDGHPVDAVDDLVLGEILPVELVDFEHRLGHVRVEGGEHVVQALFGRGSDVLIERIARDDHVEFGRYRGLGSGEGSTDEEDEEKESCPIAGWRLHGEPRWVRSLPGLVHGGSSPNCRSASTRRFRLIYFLMFPESARIPGSDSGRSTKARHDQPHHHAREVSTMALRTLAIALLAVIAVPFVPGERPAFFRGVFI